MEQALKPLVWVATTLEDLKGFPEEVRRTMGYGLYLAQLHAFQKKSRKGVKTAQADIEKIKARYRLAEELHRTAATKEESDEKRK